MARLKGRDGPDVAARASREWLERVELADVENKKCEELSKGMQQKLQFISTVIHEPDLLILDEPFSGLDPVNMRLLRDLVLEQHRRGRHDHLLHPRDAPGRADLRPHRDDQRRRQGARREPSRRSAPSSIRARCSSSRSTPSADVGAPAGRVPGVEQVSRTNGAYEISLADGTEPSPAMAALRHRAPGGAGRAEPAHAGGRLHPDRHRRR